MAMALPVVRIAYWRHQAMYAYDSQFNLLALLHVHCWDIVPLWRHSPRTIRRTHLQLCEFMQEDIPRPRIRTTRNLLSDLPQELFHRLRARFQLMTI